MVVNGDRGNESYGLPEYLVFVTFLDFFGHESGVAEPRFLQVILERRHEGMSKRKSRTNGVCFSLMITRVVLSDWFTGCSASMSAYHQRYGSPQRRVEQLVPDASPYQYQASPAHSTL